MIRRDNPQDAEKARNYSNFWIEVAMGKDGSQGATATLAGHADDDLDLTDPTDLADLGVLQDGTDVAAPEQETKPARSKATEKKQESPRSLSSLADLANIDMLMNKSADMGDETEVDLASGEAEDLDVPLTTDFNFDESGEEEEAAADSLDDDYDEDFEDDEEDDGWGGGRKSKPSKPQKQRRDQRRPF